MTNPDSSIISHLSLGTHDLERAANFYDRVLGSLGVTQLESFPGAVAYGRSFPEFWIQTPIDGTKASVGNGTHVGFIATSKQAVHAFHEAALAAGGRDEGAPGPRPHYGEPYYGCFILDPDGHKIEAAYWDTSLDEKK